MRMEVEGGTLRVLGIKELSSVNSSLLQEELLAVFNSDLSDIEVDLSETVLMDCSGLGMLLSLDRICRERHGGVRLKNPSPQIEQLLELTRMERLMETVRDY